MAHVSHILKNAFEGALAGGGDPATSPLYVFGPFLRLIVVAGVAQITFGASVWMVVVTVAVVSAMYRLVMQWITDGSGGSGLSEEELLILFFVRHADHRGSDVRITTGEVFRSATWPRQAVDPDLWKWKVAIACKWAWEEHINPLEGRANLSMMRWRTRKVARLGTKFGHLLDSQVNIGIMTKKRSSSGQMNLVARKCSCLELAGFLHPVYVFCRSERNPADAPS